MPLSQKQLFDVCMVNSGADECRYLKADHTQWSVYHCQKKRKNVKAKIDQKIKEYLDDCKVKGIDPASTGMPLGDNCEGYLLLKYLQQGYDC